MNEDGTPQTAAQWVHHNSQHKKSVRLVLNELAGFIDAGNNCPSHKELAERTGLSKTTVTHALGELEKDGTIASVKHGGDKKNGGKKNCYTLPGMTPVKSAHPGKVADTKVNGDTPVKSVTPVENAEPVEDARTYTGGDDTRDAATRVTDLSFTEQKELKEFDSTTNSLMLEDTRGQDAAPISTGDAFEDDLRTRSPEKQAEIRALIAKAQPPATGVTNAPNPNVPAAPLPPPVDPATDAYVRRCGYSPAGKEQVSLDALIKLHGTEKTAELIRDCDKQDWQGLDVKNPAGYVLKTGTGKRKANWQPKLITPTPVGTPAPAYDPYPEGMTFQPPPGAKPKGVPAW